MFVIVNWGNFENVGESSANSLEDCNIENCNSWVNSEGGSGTSYFEIILKMDTVRIVTFGQHRYLVGEIEVFVHDKTEIVCKLVVLTAETFYIAVSYCLSPITFKLFSVVWSWQFENASHEDYKVSCFYITIFMF